MMAARNWCTCKNLKVSAGPRHGFGHAQVIVSALPMLASALPMLLA